MFIKLKMWHFTAKSMVYVPKVNASTISTTLKGVSLITPTLRLANKSVWEHVGFIECNTRITCILKVLVAVVECERKVKYHPRCKLRVYFSWQWRHNEPNGISNPQRLDLFRRQPFVQAQTKENIKAPCHWPLWGEITGDRPSNAENVSIWWRHHVLTLYDDRVKIDTSFCRDTINS